MCRRLYVYMTVVGDYWPEINFASFSLEEAKKYREDMIKKYNYTFPEEPDVVWVEMPK